MKLICECGYECDSLAVPVRTLSGRTTHYDNREPDETVTRCPECGRRDSFEEKEQCDE